MRFMSFYRPGEEATTPPSEQEMAAMGQLIDEMKKAGVLVATDGLLPSTSGAVVRVSNGEFAVTDGPFIETKDLIAGYAIIQAASKAEAISWTKRFLEVVGCGECEVRQMYDGGPEGCGEQHANRKRTSATAGDL